MNKKIKRRRRANWMLFCLNRRSAMVMYLLSRLNLHERWVSMNCATWTTTKKRVVRRITNCMFRTFFNSARVVVSLAIFTFNKEKKCKNVYLTILVQGKVLNLRMLSPLVSMQVIKIKAMTQSPLEDHLGMLDNKLTVSQSDKVLIILDRVSIVLRLVIMLVCQEPVPIPLFLMPLVNL